LLLRGKVVQPVPPEAIGTGVVAVAVRSPFRGRRSNVSVSESAIERSDPSPSPRWSPAMIDVSDAPWSTGGRCEGAASRLASTAVAVTVVTAVKGAEGGMGRSLMGKPLVSSGIGTATGQWRVIRTITGQTSW
jgi:hypothetical protein